MNLLRSCLFYRRMFLSADYKALRKLVVSKPFEGRMISVQKVAHSSCVIVHGVTFLNEEIISLHFENEGRSGGGEVEAVSKHNDFAIIEFKNRNGMCTLYAVLEL